MRQIYGFESENQKSLDLGAWFELWLRHVMRPQSIATVSAQISRSRLCIR
jgi:hypothetical protein